MVNLLSTVGTIVLTPLVGYVIWLLKQKVRDGQCSNSALKILLLHDLKEDHAKHMQSQSISREDFNSFEQAYDVYHSLKGNGLGTKMFEDIKRLPITL